MVYIFKDWQKKTFVSQTHKYTHTYIYIHIKCVATKEWNHSNKYSIEIIQGKTKAKNKNEKYYEKELKIW